MVFGFLGLALAIAYQQIGVTGLLAFAAPPLMMRLAMKQYVDQDDPQRRDAEAEERAASEGEPGDPGDEREAEGDVRRHPRGARRRPRCARQRDRRPLQPCHRLHDGHGAEYSESQRSSDEWLDIERASLLHDVGKIGVSDAILNKPGPLTSEEWQQMRKHPAIGYEMLKDVKFLSTAAEIVYAHHERYDGKGYPTGLKGEDVPLGARIFAVADAFDAMTSNRPYRRALSADKAREEITTNSGTQFDPAVVEAFLRCLPDWTVSLKDRAAA